MANLPADLVNVVDGTDDVDQAIMERYKTNIDGLKDYYSKGGVVHDVKHPDYGAVGDGVEDDTAAIEAAINNSEGGCVYFPPGEYLVTDRLNITVKRYSLQGSVCERGTNALATTSGYPTTTIKFRPANNTTYLVSLHEHANPSAVLGPFEHKNLTFDLRVADLSGSSMGFEFGDPSESPVSDGEYQRYVFGVRFDGCAFHGNRADRDCVDGVLSRDYTIFISLTKCFEAVINDCSFLGGDTQIKGWGCDKPTIRNVRSQASHIPIHLLASGSFRVQHTINNLQVEGWTFAPIVSNVELAASDIRLEQKEGSGKYDLTGELGITASVTEGSSTLTFSSDMTNILFPDLSIIQITDGTIIQNCFVTDVSTTTVTVDAITRINFTDATANVTRIHGYGPIHMAEFQDASYVNISSGASENCPAFVYVVGRSGMSIVNAGRRRGNDLELKSMVIGNRLEAQYYLNSQMAFSNCSPLVIADPEEPLVYVDNWRESYGVGYYSPNSRSKPGERFYALSLASRVWPFTPKNSGTSKFDSHLIPFVELNGDAYSDEGNTAERIWAWYLYSGCTTPFRLYNDSLPSDPNGLIRLRMKVRSVGASGTMQYGFVGDGISGLVTIDLTDDWLLYERVLELPVEWQTNPPTLNRGFAFYDDDYYIAVVTVEELSDVAGTGGFKQPFNFMQIDVAANQAAVALDVLGLEGNTEVVMPYAGSVIGVSVATNDSRAAGSLTVDVTVNGTVTGLQAVLDGSNADYHSATQMKDTDTFSAGNRIGVKITTDAGWLPITADVVVVVIVEM